MMRAADNSDVNICLWFIFCLMMIMVVMRASSVFMTVVVEASSRSDDRGKDKDGTKKKRR